MTSTYDTVGRRFDRRHFLGLTAGGAAFALVACGDDDDAEGSPSPTTAATSAPDDDPTATAEPNPSPTADDAGGDENADGNGDDLGAQGTVIIGDVVEHSLDAQGWAGEFGFVTFRLHTASVDGEPAYFIRCDASDPDFAESEGLVHVPLMANALTHGAGYGDIYLFENGAEGQVPVLSTAPQMDDYTPAYRISRVQFTGDAVAVDSAQAIQDAVDAGSATIEETDIVVNYPVVKWPGGEMPVDEGRTEYLGGGQLLEPVDVAGGTVTFKLHACHPASRYIVTDVSMAPMAPMMNIAPSPGTEPLTDAGATAKILVFGNGIEGSGPMGFQKSVTDTTAGDPEWSSFWDHFTFVWDEAAEPLELTTFAEIEEREAAGDLERFNGTPDTHPTVFVVNCPVPVLAPIR